jgi:hypothetical protein
MAIGEHDASLQINDETRRLRRLKALRVEGTHGAHLHRNNRRKHMLDCVLPVALLLVLVVLLVVT